MLISGSGGNFDDDIWHVNGWEVAAWKSTNKLLVNQIANIPTTTRIQTYCPCVAHARPSLPLLAAWTRFLSWALMTCAVLCQQHCACLPFVPRVAMRYNGKKIEIEA